MIIPAESLFRAMDQLGIRNVPGRKPLLGYGGGGRIERLATARNARVIYLDHGNQAMMDKVSATPLWQSLPFVQQTSSCGRCRRCGSTGATLSTMCA
ncbi:hypothetical protein M8494_26785 [Serratia ureilytica]